MNEEFEFEAFDEQPFFFETEEEAESLRRGRMPSRRFVPGRGTRGRRKTFSQRPVIGQRFNPRFPIRFPVRAVVRPPVWPGLLTPTYPLPLEPYPVDPPDRPPRWGNRPSGPSGAGRAPEPADTPMDDEPVSGTSHPDMPQNPPDSASAPDAVGVAPAGVEGPGPEDPSVPADSPNDASEYYLGFESDAPSSSSSTTFIPTPVENPGGGRIKNKRPPDRTDVVNVRGVGQRQIPLHRLAASALEALINAARADGLAEPLLRPVSGFRDPARQARLWQAALARYGSPQEARKWVAPPGGSAHQSGRAIDFYLGGRNASNNVAQLRTLPAYRWLVANARRFGFYPYQREPWHWEYNPPVAAGNQEFSREFYGASAFESEFEVNISKVENRGRRNLERGVLVRRTIPVTLRCDNPRDLILAPTIAAEGGYDSVNLYDRGILSWGIMQSTAHLGGLQGLLGFIKQNNPNAFRRHFGRVGLDVVNGQFVYQGRPVLIGPNSTQLRLLFRGRAERGAYDEQVISQWATVFALAGRDPVVQELQQQYARLAVDRSLNSPHKLLHGRSPRELLGNELVGLCTFFSLRINNPRQAYMDLQRAVTQAGGAQAGAPQIAAAFARVLSSSSFNGGRWSQRAAAVPAAMNRARARCR
jgi:LAS superfamily LD-carboxypeptidase LdcB